MKGGSRQGQSKVKERSRQGQVKSKQYKHNLNRNYNLMGFDTIEINLVSYTKREKGTDFFSKLGFLKYINFVL